MANPMPQPAAKVLVIGVGNAYRGDDAIGPLIASRLRPAGVRVVESPRDSAALIEAWRGERALIIVDAAISGATAGTIYRIDASTDPIPCGLLNHSTHALGVAEAIELARTLGQLPPRVIVYGIEAAAFDIGSAMSAAVLKAGRAVEALVLEDIEAMREPAGRKM